MVDLPPGDYELALAAAGHEEWRDLARVTGGEAMRADARPSPLPAPTGDLTVTSSAAGALIEIDGEPSGFAPTVIAGIDAGPHRVHVSHSGLEPWAGDISVGSDARAWLTVSLVPPPATTRSPLSWAVGGVGLAALLAGAILGGLALSAQGRFASLEQQQTAFAMGMGTAPRGSLADLRDQQISLSTASDVTLAIGAAAVIGAIVLFFTTEETDTRHSEGTFSEEER